MMRRVGLVVLVAGLSGACATALHADRYSPWQAGIDLRIAPRIDLGLAENMEVRPTAAYKRLFTSGGSNTVEFGGQLRFTPDPWRDRGWWVGGEVQGSANFVGGGGSRAPRSGPGGSSVFWTVPAGVLFGIPVELGEGIRERATTHLYAGAGSSLTGGGFYFRIGLEFNPVRKQP